MRIRRLILICAAMLPLLGGCWDNVDISRQNYAMTAALDGTANSVGCLLQCADPISPESDTGTVGTSSVIVPGSGAGISDAFGSATRNSSKTITYEHLQLIVLGKDMYESSANDCLQYFVRSADVQKSVSVVITDGVLSEMLEAKPGGEPFYDYVLGLLSSDLPNESKHIPGSSLLTVSRRQKDGHPFFINKIRFDKDDNSIYPDGAGIFSGDIYVGCIGSEDWENSRWFEKSSGDFYITCPVKGYGEGIGFRCVTTECRLKAERQGDGFALSAEIDADFVLSEYHGDEPQKITSREFYTAAENSLESEVLARSVSIAKIAQEELKTDFLGFSIAAERESPDSWDDLRDAWNGIFSAADISYNITCSVLTSGDMR